MKFISSLIIILLLIPLVYSNYFLSDEAEKIYTSAELVILQRMTGSVNITYANSNRKINDFYANFYISPYEDYRQKLLNQSIYPSGFKIENNSIKYHLTNIKDDSLTFRADFLMKTRNEFAKITSKVLFPLENLTGYDEFLKSTEMIDINEDIINQASLIASGKDDLFDVAESIAFWVYDNIEYDVSSISVDAQQPASWVLENRKGVCDESTVLFISMVRSLGIPARFVSGISYTNDDYFSEPWLSHAWAEVYFPGQGWVPFDLTYGQFGYIDAGHMKYEESFDATGTTMDYSWRARNIKDIDVKINSLIFNTTLISAKGSVSDDFSIVIDPLYEKVSPGSYNVLRIKLKNEKDYYVSSVLTFVSPIEVDVRETIPIFLKPHEEKFYYQLMKVDDLNSGLIYEMPINIITGFGHVHKSSFTVQSGKKDISKVEAENFIDSKLKKTSSRIKAICDFKNTLYVNQSNSLNCLISNEGNTHIKSSICLNQIFPFKKRIVCENKTLSINNIVKFNSELIYDDVGKKEFELTIKYNEQQQKDIFSFNVVDTPKLNISIIYPKQVNIDDDIILFLTLKKITVANAKDAIIEINVGDEVLDWEIGDVKNDMEINIPFDTYYLKEGLNKIDFKIKWDYGSYDESLNIELEHIAFMKKLEMWFFKLFF